MSRNVESFRNFIKEQNLYLEEGKNQDGSSFFRAEQRLENGGSVILAVIFDINNEDFVEIYVFNIAEIRDAYKKESALKLINELNAEFRYSKFILDSSGRVTSNYCLMFENNFNPSVVLRQLVLALNSADEVYPKFMKLAWS